MRLGKFTRKYRSLFDKFLPFEIGTGHINWISEDIHVIPITAQRPNEMLIVL